MKELEEENKLVYSLMLSGERRGIEKATQEFNPQVETLKAERNAAGMRERNNLLPMLEAWKAYAGRLEKSGNELTNCIACGCDDGGCKICRGSEDRWTKAKETKP